ncbi:MAG: hypothetical protein LBC19_05835 [Tannerella sp.]|nr:hypothetical protein [Tannerella sp.]
MGNKNRNSKDGSPNRTVPVSVMSALEKVNKGDDTPLSKDEILAFMSGKTTAEAVSTNTGENSGTVETTRPAKQEVEKQETTNREVTEQPVTEQETDIDASFQKWLEEIKQRPIATKRKFIYIDGDVLDVFSELRKSTGLPATQCINNILIDWINANRKSIIAIINARARNRILNDI